jgi:uncharacterized protein (DUF433 family)
MKPDDRFVFETFETPHGVSERIRIKGHRIALENVIEYYKEGNSAEDIQRDIYPSLTLADVQAAIDYYEQYRDDVEAYIERGERIADAYYQEDLLQPPPPVVARLRALKAAQREEKADDGESPVPVR